MSILHKFATLGLSGPTYISTDLSSYQQQMAEIHECHRKTANFTNEKLKDYMAELRAQARSGTPLSQLLAPTFGLVKEACIRQLQVSPFDLQLLAAIPLHERKLVEMQTGEGKTLSAVFAAALNALSGEGVHILTFNDYLAKRDAEWMGPIYTSLGMTVGYIANGMSRQQKQAAYACDITYATAKEVGFDFLRSYLAFEKEEQILQPFHFAIVDEADAILIDEARNPLVLAGQMGASVVDVKAVAQFVKTLQPQEDYILNESSRAAFLTEKGVESAEKAFGLESLIEEAHFGLHTAINLALQAQTLLTRDVDYLVKNERILLVDEFTGRVVEDRKWRNGLQTAVEAKEGLPIQSEGSILNAISLQHLIQKYPGVAGMTATAQAAAKEFATFYGLQTIVIPPNKTTRRIDYPDLIFADKTSKQAGILAEVKKAHHIGQPILIGALTVKESESLAALFREHDIDCEVLNAKNDEEEARIIADAGRVGAVTISTNMAGRGTDIQLGGKDKSDRKEVIRYGGLYVIGTNRHESVRIDQQLRGRAGRQGDLGQSRFFISLEDDLMVKYKLNDILPKRFQSIEGAAPIIHKKVRKFVGITQHIIESQLLDMRTNLYQYSAFTEKQRIILQSERQRLLEDIHCLSEFFPSLPDIRNATVQQLTLMKTFVLLQYDKYWAQHLDLLSHLREGIHLVRLGGQNPLRTFRQLADACFNQLYSHLENELEPWVKKVMTNEITAIDQMALEKPSSTWTYVINDNPFDDQLAIMLLDSANVGMHVDFVSAPFLFTIAMMRRMRRKKR
ncbi:MAG: accessory Sec system translocase SecA2 [Saprospiraceae bacterium]